MRHDIDTHVAMKLSGQTEAVFPRYDIISETDLREAAARLDSVGKQFRVMLRSSRRSAPNRAKYLVT